jgi:hypothetical protein
MCPRTDMLVRRTIEERKTKMSTLDVTNAAQIRRTLEKVESLDQFVVAFRSEPLVATSQTSGIDSQRSLRLIKRNGALNISGRIQNTNLAGTEARAALSVFDCVLFRGENRLDAFRGGAVGFIDWLDAFIRHSFIE